MDDLRTRAHLVAYDSAFTGPGAIGTVITRAEIADTAARGEFPATLLLDLERGENAGDVTAHATVAIDWDEDTITQLLATMDEPEIELWFTEADLAEAFDDVEAHGVRQKAAMLAVAAVADGASATPAFARFAADAQGGGGTAGAAPSATASAQQGGPLGAQRALQEDEQIGSRQFHAVSPNATPTTPAVAPGAERALQVDEMMTPRIVHGFVAQPSATSTGGTLSGTEIATIGGVGALLIAAAGFGVTRKREQPGLPA
jgi:hypothetical protein